MAKPRSLKIWFTLTAVAAIAGGAYYYLHGRSGPKPEFATVKISRSEIIQSVTATGTLQPVTTVEISSQISGLIQEVKVDYNSKVKQGDLLTSLGPMIAVRGDTFLIRGYGEARDASGKNVLARSWCEAVVQRVPDYVDPTNNAYDALTALNNINKTLGRRFNIVSFRYLDSREIL